MKSTKKKWSVQWIQVFLEIKLLFGKLRRHQALGPWPTSSQRSCRRFTVSSGEGIQGQRHNTAHEWLKWESLLKWKVYFERCEKERGSKGCTQRELPALGGWVSIFQLLTKGRNIHSLGVEIFWKQGFVLFLPYLFRGFLSWHPPSWACLVWSHFLWSAARAGLWLPQELATASSLVASRHPVRT